MAAKRRIYKWLKTGLLTLAWTYLVFLLGRAILQFIFGDRWTWLFLLNTFALYLFLPLPLVIGATFLSRQRLLWVGCGVSLAVGLLAYGGLFLPRLAPMVENAPTLTVITYNVLGTNQDIVAVLRVVRTSNADVITLQELNPTLAEALQEELGDEYPYQILNIGEEWSGAGTISRYPLAESDETLGSQWFEAPQVLTVDFKGEMVMLVHFHTAATSNYRNADHIALTVRVREEQAQAVVNLVQSHSGPLIAPTDFNATDQSTAYQILTDTLHDSWREAGWGPGHTFPGAAPNGHGSRLQFMGLPLPRWLLRIDYVFHSDHWQAISARTGPWDGTSDHRPVVVTLQLKEDN